MGRIQWRDTMSVDRGVIDEDHQHLIDIINRFGSYTARGEPDVAGALGILNALKFYAENHFAREERLQRLVGYPEHRLQHDEHQRLMATLDEIIARAVSAPGPGPSDVPGQLGLLLRRWLLDHVIKLDLRMKPYAELIRRQSQGLPGLGAISRGPAAPPAA
jgi:hemerythrin-like metal-binding protein